MTTNHQLREAAREIFRDTLAAVDAHDAVRRAVSVGGSRITVKDQSCEIAAEKFMRSLGKAAYAMATGLSVSSERL
jgi:glycerate-2-kinase